MSGTKRSQRRLRPDIALPGHFCSHKKTLSIKHWRLIFLNILFSGLLAVRQHHLAAVAVLFVIFPPLFFLLLSSFLGKRMLLMPLGIHSLLKIFIILLSDENQSIRKQPAGSCLINPIIDHGSRSPAIKIKRIISSKRLHDVGQVKHGC